MTTPKMRQVTLPIWNLEALIYSVKEAKKLDLQEDRSVKTYLGVQVHPQGATVWKIPVEVELDQMPEIIRDKSIDLFVWMDAVTIVLQDGIRPCLVMVVDSGEQDPRIYAWPIVDDQLTEPSTPLTPEMLPVGVLSVMLTARYGTPEVC